MSYMYRRIDVCKSQLISLLTPYPWHQAAVVLPTLGFLGGFQEAFMASKGFRGLRPWGCHGFQEFGWAVHPPREELLRKSGAILTCAGAETWMQLMHRAVSTA